MVLKGLATCGMAGLAAIGFVFEHMASSEFRDSWCPMGWSFFVKPALEN